MELEQKIDKTLEILKKGEGLALSLNPELGYNVAFSGGKDSQVMYALVKMAGVKHHAQYSVCGIDSPTNIYFIRENYPEVEFMHPKEKFIALVRKKGLPTMQRRFCCERTKEWLGKGEVVLTGVRAEESRRRAAYAQIQVISRRREHQGKDKGRSEEWLQQVEHNCIKGQDRVMIHPILNWTENEVWEFIKTRGLPVNPCYANAGRVGCMFCPFASRAQIEMYEKLFPKFKKAVINAVGRYWKTQNEHYLSSPSEYYEWWKSRKSVSDFLQMRHCVPLND